MNLTKEIARIKRRLKRWQLMRDRMWFANPDLCIFLANYCRFGHRYLKRRGAKKGHYMIQVGYLTFSIAW